MREYIPEQGDIILLDFNPQAGHEQMGHRPAFVVSTYTFNRFTKLAMVCPITNTKRGYPLHVLLDERTSTTGVIMCEQVKTLDIVVRNAVFVEKAPEDITHEVADIIRSSVEPDKY